MRTEMHLRQVTSAELAESNPILSVGEVAHEIDNDRFCFGDGKTRWSRLPKYSRGGGGGDTPEGAVTFADITPGVPVNARIGFNQYGNYPNALRWTSPASSEVPPLAYRVDVNGIDPPLIVSAGNPELNWTFVPNVNYLFEVRSTGVLSSAPATLNYTWVVPTNPAGYNVEVVLDPEMSITTTGDGIKNADGDPYEGYLTYAIFAQRPDGTIYNGGGSTLTINGEFTIDTPLYGEYIDAEADVKLLLYINGTVDTAGQDGDLVLFTRSFA